MMSGSSSTTSTGTGSTTSTTITTTPAVGGGGGGEPFFALPPSVPQDDVPILENVLTALQSLGTDSGSASGAAVSKPLFARYKVELVTTGYLLRAALPQGDLFELSHDDLLYLQSISPARIDSIAIGRSTAGGPCELLVRILNGTQRLMVTSTVAFFSATRKRKFQKL